MYRHLIEFIAVSELSLIVNRELTSHPIPPVDNISLMSVQTASSYSKYGMDQVDTGQRQTEYYTHLSDQ